MSRATVLLSELEEAGLGDPAILKQLAVDAQWAKSKTKGVWPGRLDRIIKAAQGGDTFAYQLVDQELRTNSGSLPTEVDALKAKYSHQRRSTMNKTQLMQSMELFMSMRR